MRVRDSNLIKHIKLSTYLDVDGANAWLLKLIELLYHDLNKNVPFSETKSLIEHGRFFLAYFNAWIRKFHQNCRALSFSKSISSRSLVSVCLGLKKVLSESMKKSFLSRIISCRVSSFFLVMFSFFGRGKFLFEINYRLC